MKPFTIRKHAARGQAVRESS
jgi:hypothetical protein